MDRRSKEFLTQIKAFFSRCNKILNSIHKSAEFGVTVRDTALKLHKAINLKVKVLKKAIDKEDEQMAYETLHVLIVLFKEFEKLLANNKRLFSNPTIAHEQTTLHNYLQQTLQENHLSNKNLFRQIEVELRETAKIGHHKVAHAAKHVYAVADEIYKHEQLGKEFVKQGRKDLRHMYHGLKRLQNHL